MKTALNKNIIIFIVIFIIACIGGYYYIRIGNYKKEIAELNRQINEYKSAANPSKEIIDSIEYNIIYRDSIIYKLKTEYVKDVEVIKNMPDSCAVNLFKELVWAD